MTAALITGSSKRVGRALALALAEQGWDIALHCHTSTDEAAELKTQIEKLGRKAEVFSFDLTNISGVESWFSEVHRVFPDLSLLINNAAEFRRINFAEITPDNYQQHMVTNLASPVFLTQAFAKSGAQGQVINMLDSDITSTHGSHFPYLLSKKALAEFTQMAARELGPDIRVNAICPGPVLPTDQTLEGYEERLKEKLPLKELSNVEDITRAMQYLLTSTHVTGQLLFTNSGQHLL